MSKHIIQQAFERPLLAGIDRLKFSYLIIAAFLLTTGFAALYFTSSHPNTGHGILAIDDTGARRPVTISDALYFSVVTEATLGYGDIRPVGTSRALACIQVFAGLVLAGLFVAKITSGRERKLRLADSRCKGYWFEIFQSPRKPYLSIAFVEMSYDGETIHYNGTNYRADGGQDEDFASELISLKDNILTFFFQNQERAILDEGVTVLNFYNYGQGKRWEYYRGALYDMVEEPKRVLMYGFRAEPEVVKGMKAAGKAEKAELVRRVFAGQRAGYEEFVGEAALHQSGRAEGRNS